MNSINSTDGNTPETMLAEEMVRASVSRFETAVDHLVEKVENTGLTVRHAMDFARGFRTNPQALIYALTGIVGGFLIFRFTHKQLRRRTESRNLVNSYPEGNASTWISP